MVGVFEETNTCSNAAQPFRLTFVGMAVTSAPQQAWEANSLAQNADAPATPHARLHEEGRAGLRSKKEASTATPAGNL